MNPEELNHLEETLLLQAKEEGIQKLGVGALVFRDEKLLLIKRASQDDFLPNLVELPSGGVEPGETLIAALHRELLEETGMAIQSIVGFANAMDYKSASGRSTRQFHFIIEPVDYAITLNPKEHSDYYWIAIDDASLGALSISPEMKACIAQAIAVKRLSPPLRQSVPRSR